MTKREILEEALKKQWLSNFQMQLLVRSSSADRRAREIRQTPPNGFVMIQRRKELPDGYGYCNEYHLIKGSVKNIETERFFDEIFKKLGAKR